ncbi:MAG TPA: P-loop NTPase fold protein [Candidatus Limnocylindrales bacterium]
MADPAGPMFSRDKDLLGRRALAGALAQKLYDHVTGPKDIDPGPTVVTVEGPWGCGKSTLLDLIRDHFPDPPTTAPAAARLTVRAASRMLRDGQPPAPPSSRAAAPRGVVTAWFNPWAHQSGEQVWAGLVAEIIQAARPVLYPTENARERYWLGRNLTRIDRYAVRRTLHRRMLSPELTLGALGVVASFVIAVAELETTVNLVGLKMPTATMALLVASTFLLVGAVHTGWRYLRGAAARFLPGELFHGPMTVAPDVDGNAPGSQAEGLADPLRRARAGSLYLHQHDVSELITDLDHAGYELIVFVDDLDRCRALTTAEVFEAINLFLAGFVAERRSTGRDSPDNPDNAGGNLHARFVIGLDPVVVAGHLDRVYADLYDADTALDAEDPGPGWAFLRKLVHLPVLVPQISDEEMFRIVDQIAGIHTPNPASPTIPAQTGGGGWLLQRDPQVQAMVRARLTAQPDRSIREATRQLNLWEFYERILTITTPLQDDGPRRERSQHLVVLAEIVTRWPALQRFLHRRHGTRTGLQLLAAAAANDDEWSEAATLVFAGHAHAGPALASLRRLLLDHHGVDVAALGARLL